MPIDPTTFIASVATSVAASIFVEQFVKPHVERIKELQATRRELMARIVSLSLSAVVLAEELPKDMDREVRQRINDERTRQGERLRLAVQQLFDDAGRYLAVYAGVQRQFVRDYIMCMQGLMLSTRTRTRNAEIIRELSIPVATVLDPQRQRPWRVIGNLKALRKAQKIMTATHTDQREAED
ncbi:hypothetical protein [Micromonospora wenchangensis]|uniref:hypothetical protein n=1 Tax=Micromonospora wenchangensis TaxID=1185415 RepID=UPI0037F83368